MSEKEILQKTAPAAEDAGNEVDNAAKLDFEEGPTEDSEVVEEVPAEEDANMDETDEERKQRACRQGKLTSVPKPF